MSGPVVCDASVLVAALLDRGPDGEWAVTAMAQASLAAPQLALFEAANVIRRQQLARLVGADQAAQAHADLLALQIELWPYPPLADRAWELRRNLTVYDASYVALAELLGATLVTLDRRLAQARAPRCRVATP